MWSSQWACPEENPGSVALGGWSFAETFEEEGRARGPGQVWGGEFSVPSRDHGHAPVHVHGGRRGE